MKWPRGLEKCARNAKVNDFHFIWKGVCTVVSGIFRIWQREGPWRARGARAYNDNLGTEPMQSHMAALIAYRINILKIIRHCWIMQLLLENGNICTFWYKGTCIKFSWSSQRGQGAIAPWPPLNMPLVVHINLTLHVITTLTIVNDVWFCQTHDEMNFNWIRWHSFVTNRTFDI